MMSFKTLDEFEIFINGNSISLKKDKINYTYYYDDASCYKLEQENNSSYYVIDFNSEMYLTIIPSNNDYQLYGFIDDNITFMNYLDSIDMDRLISNNEVEYINEDDDPADYNASLYLPVGDYETIYIVCTAINVYSSGQLTLSLTR